MTHNTDSGWRERFIEGGWIPPSREALRDSITHKVPHSPRTPYLHPTVQELKRLIDEDPEVYMGFHDMLAQKAADPITDTQSLLDMLSDAVTTSPKWNQESAHPGLNINDIVSSIVTTDFGFATFLNPKVNAAFKKILDAWTRYLATPDSASVLITENWLSEDAMKKLAKYLPPGGTPTEQFKTAFVRPSVLLDKHWGFQSWDSFFARRFVDINKTRPLPPADDNVIVSACESTIYNIDRNAKETGEFWLKGKAYSLRMMLNDDEFAPLFYGGTVYQAFLDVWDYHRWHSPVNGIVRRVVNVSGTYYALPPDFYKDLDKDKEVQGIVEAQAFLAVAATRALIFIESDNPDIGLLCFIGVGMIDVSSCEITVRAGDRVAKGDQIGAFHFGGSTSCLVFQPGLYFDLDSKWNDPAKTPPKDASHVPIRAQLGTLKKIGEVGPAN